MGLYRFLELRKVFSGLFHKAIIQSASVLTNWAIGRKDGAICLAKALGFQSNDEREILTFLRKVPAVDLLKASQKVRVLTDVSLGLSLVFLELYFMTCDIYV